MAATSTWGGAISGYCATGRLRMAARPAMTMKIEITMAKIGRSMKKRENMVDQPPGLGGAGAAPASSLSGVACTGAPGPSFRTPSTMTWSPAARPPVTTMSPPLQSETSTFHLGLVILADDIDELALGAFEHGPLGNAEGASRVALVSLTRTNWPGLRRRSGWGFRPAPRWCRYRGKSARRRSRWRRCGRSRCRRPA